MKAATIHQPWAGLIALGMKQFETRGWATSYRGPLAIHAGKNEETLLWLVREMRELQRVGMQPHPETHPLQYYFAQAVEDTSSAIPWTRGAIVAVADLVDCIPVRELERDGVLSQQERALGDYSPGRYAWKLENVRRLAEPVFCRGQQGLWSVPEDVLVWMAAVGEVTG